MRRPLLLVCLCLVMAVAFCYFAGDATHGGVFFNGGAFSNGGAAGGDAANEGFIHGEKFLDGQALVITGRIYQKDDTSFYLKIKDVAAGSRQDNSKTNLLAILKKRKIICECEGAEGLMLGSFVTLRGDFLAFSGATNPGEFDYAKYYRSLGFAGRVKNVEVLAQSEQYSRLLELLYRLKCYWKDRLYRIFPEKEASVMTAVLLGDKSDLDSHIKELYRNNGMIHILSISGLHITMIGLGLYRLLRRLGMSVWPASICSGIVLVLYGILTGLSVSACRAIGMYLLRMLAPLCKRTYDMLTALGIMAALLVLCNPGYLEHMGFWPSFASIAGVGVLCPAITPTKEERRPEKKKYAEGRGRRFALLLWGKVRETARQGFLAGISITLTALPLQLWFTYEVPVYSVFLNMLVLPFMGIVMAFGLIAMLIPGLGIFGTVDILVLAGYEGLCMLFERLPFRFWNPGRPQIWQIVVFYLLWLVVVCGTNWYRQMRKPSSAVAHAAAYSFALPVCKAVIMTLAVLTLGISFHRGDKVTFLDVGQGDCVCVQLATGEVYLFDCGSTSRNKIAEKVLVPFLKYNGISHIDGIFMSHPDADHTNGLLELLAMGEQEHITVDCVVFPGIPEEEREEELGELLAAVRGASQKRPIVVGYVQAGDLLWSGEFGRKFLCVHPPAGFSTEDANAYSECFYMELEGGFSLLLTGDIEGEGEEALQEELHKQGIKNVIVLKTAHHGSRNSTSEELLRQVSPRVALISCGRNNRYGHPHAETLERLQNVGAAVFRTDKSGAVTLWVEGGEMMLETFLE